MTFEIDLKALALFLGLSCGAVYSVVTALNHLSNIPYVIAGILIAGAISRIAWTVKNKIMEVEREQ